MNRRKTLEDYLKNIYIIRQRKGCVYSVDIAEDMKVSRPTVCIALKGMVKDGYVKMNSEHEIILTPKGMEIAVDTYERNLTLKKLLLKLGVDKKTAEEDACLMEHAVSQKSYMALKSLTIE